MGLYTIFFEVLVFRLYGLIYIEIKFDQSRFKFNVKRRYQNYF